MPRYEGRRTGMRLLALNAPLACCLLEGQRATNDAKRKELKTLMDTLDKEIDSLTEQQAKITATLEKNGIKVETNIPELAKERDNLRPEVTKLYDAMRALRGTFKKDNDTWWETEKVWRDRADRKIKWEADRKQQLIDDELYRKEMFEMEQSGDSDPFAEQKRGAMVKNDVFT